MGFIRTKKIRKKEKVYEYAYIVENKRYKRKGIRQKTKKYLGRAYRFDRENVMDFYEFYGIDDVDAYVKRNSRESVILDLIRLELFNYGFKEEGGVFRKNECCFDGENFFSNKGRIALAFNEGFLSDFTMQRLMKFRAEVEEDGYLFAKYFVEAGLAVPKEVFVGIFRKVFKEP